MSSNNSKSQSAFDSSRLSHAYIVTSDELANDIAMAVVCSARDVKRPCMICADCDKASRRIHPDIIKVGKLEGKHIVSVDQIRELKQDVFIVPNDSIQKAYLVEDADTMNNSAQNAFLQILEEPPAHVVFVLRSDNQAVLLPTVRSRCIEIKSQAIDDIDDTENDSSELAELVDDFIEALTGNNVLLMECMFRIDKLDRFALGDFLSLAREGILLSLRNVADDNDGRSKVALVHADHILAEAGEMLSLNVSAGHISGFICASTLSV